jgi:hypothetical protein
MTVKISEDDEQRLRSLAIGIAQRIRDPEEILAELGFSEDDWRELEKSRIFRRLLEQAQAEWNSVTKTSQRVKLKAGVNIELSLPQFYADMIDPGHPLVARVKALELMARLAGLPEQEVGEHAPGAQFKLEIHLGDNRVDVVNIGPAIPEKPESFKLPTFLLPE